MDPELAMNFPSESAGPGGSLVLALLLGVSGCSGIAAEDQSGFGDEVGDEYGDGDGDTTGQNGTDSGTDSGTDGGTDTGTSDSGPEEGLADARLVTAACDPEQGSVIDYGLAEAHAEIAAELVRESVMSHASVPLIPLSTRPFFNHFHFEYPAATEATLAITGEIWKPQAMLEVSSPRYQLQFAISGPALLDEQRPPLDLAIVVDIGPSMVGEPLVLANEALAAVAESLRGGDRITLISAGDQAELLSSMVVADGLVPSLPNMLAEVVPAGSAVIDEGLALAYEQLEQLGELEPLPAAQARVMLISAGHFSADSALFELVDSWAELGVTLTEVGVGTLDQFAESSLRSLAEVGKGASVYGPNADQLWLGLGDDFTAKMIASASEVEVTLVLPPGLAISERDPSWGGEDSAMVEHALLGPNDSLVSHHELTACGEFDPEAAIRVEVRWQEPGLADAQELVWEQPVAELGYGSSATRKGAAVLAYTSALITYRDRLGVDARYGALLDALGRISDALESMPEDPDLIEMSEVLAKLEST